MAKNKLNIPRTHEGGGAKTINAEQQLRRSVMACLLWEDDFYEDGQTIASRIQKLIPLIKPKVVAEIAIEARREMNLRKVPLFIVREMARTPGCAPYVADTLNKVILRADELYEFLMIYWKEKRQPLSAQVKKGLAKAFVKFNEYSLAKYNRDNPVKLKDVLFLCHAKPENEEQEALWKRLINDELTVPDTWEVALSANDGISKKEKWERLLEEDKLGAMALMRNLRNMEQEGINNKTVIKAIEKSKPTRVLPFRFITASRHAPHVEEALEKKMLECLKLQDKLEGKTILLVDVSGSMQWSISEYGGNRQRSETLRCDCANGLAILLREICDDIVVLSFSTEPVRVPARHGFALADAIDKSQAHRGTYLGRALTYAQTEIPEADRIIVITDEQATDKVRKVFCKNSYMINIAVNRNGVGYGNWTHIDGWSESVVRFIQEFEKSGGIV